MSKVGKAGLRESAQQENEEQESGQDRQNSSYLQASYVSSEENDMQNFNTKSNSSDVIIPSPFLISLKDDLQVSITDSKTVSQGYFGMSSYTQY